MLVLLAACTPGSPCPDGTTRRDDGLCYAPGVPASGPTADEVVAALPACTLGEGNGRLDLEQRCLDGACAGDSYEDMNRAVGEEGLCDGSATRTPDRPHWFTPCEWSAGFSSYFPAIGEADGPYDYVPEPDVRTGWPLESDGAYTGTTTEGLGIASPLSCWIDALGEPSITLRWEDGVSEVTSASWGYKNVMLLYVEGEIIFFAWPR
ncbi:MAG: hypothetical protein Q8P18_08560 [Pseudomonadota bacterium]|nr:hypothetical protein [Pseudomonadota bacterium]